jgi:hypothetical protein
MPLEVLAKNVNLNVEEALFVQTILRCLGNEDNIVNYLSKQTNVERETLNKEMAALEAKLRNDLFTALKN